MSCNINKANKKTILISETQKNLVDDLSKKSRELSAKGESYQNDIGYLTSKLTDNFYLPQIAPQRYDLVLDAKVIDDNSFKYKFFDTTDKRMKFPKICSPFTHLKNGVTFKGTNDIVKMNSVLIQLVENYTKIRSVYLQDINTIWGIGMLLYHDLNVKLVKKTQADSTNKWWGTNPNLIWHGEIYAATKKQFTVSEFMTHMYFDKRYQSKKVEYIK